MNDIVKQENNIVTMTPDTMIGMAIQNGNIDQLDKLLAMKERYEAAEAKKAFVQAMSKFRSQCISIAKTRQGYNYKYAGLAETIEQISPHLVECNLSHRWETKQENGQITVTCYLTHIDGHSESATLTSGADTSGSKNNIQAIGSATSYLQRYTLFSVCGLASREDDDGNTSEIEYITEEQANELHAIANENNLLPRTLKWLQNKGIQSIDKIPAKEYENILATVKGQIKR